MALGRISTFLTADELETPYAIDESPENEFGVRLDGSFTWEPVERAEALPESEKKVDNGSRKDKEVATSRRWFSRKANSVESEPNLLLPASATSAASSDPQPASTTSDAEKEPDELPFALTNLSLRIPKGKFVAIVGRVGSGKSSLLQSLVGEMRKTDGDVVFGGKVAYAPQ